MADGILVLSIDAIRVPAGRFRSLKPGHAAAIGAAIAADGQYDPIAVTRLPGRDDYELVDGWHRLEGCRLAGLSTIEARLVPANKVVRTRREILSGIARAGEDVFDRAAAIDGLARLAREQLDEPSVSDLRRPADAPPRLPQEIDRDAKKAVGIIPTALRWDAKVAEELGLGWSSVRKMAQVHERIAADLKERLRARGQAGKLVPLLALSALLPEQMERVVDALERYPALDLAQAIERVSGAAPVGTPAERAQSAFFGKAGRWSPRERASFWAQWTAQYHPDGRKRAGQKD
jgi:ParB-like chromosome segregation protein Spo0J